jgi:hypothetical protein
MLDELSGAAISLRLIYIVVTIKIGLKRGMSGKLHLKQNLVYMSG